MRNDVKVNMKNNWQVSLFQVSSLLTLGGMTAVYFTYLGKPGPVETAVNLLTAGYALLATWLGMAVWAILKSDDPGRRQWAFLSIGIGLWTMAELLWAFLSYTLDETPYPSIADAFWIPGYVMVLISTTLRYRALKIQWNSKTTRVLLGIFAVIFVAVVIWVIEPIVTAGDFSDLLILLLNVFYPIADLLVLFAALLLAVSLTGGRFSTPWAVIAAGLATLSVSDILFTYADWNDLYTPKGNLTWLTTIVDVGNLAAYALIAYGILLNHRLLAVGPIPEQQPVPTQVGPANLQKVMIFIDDTDRVVFANYNLSRLLFTGASNAVGMPIGEVLGISPQDAQSLLAELHSPYSRRIEKYIAQYRANRAEICGWLRGQANFNELREYTGADITCDIQWQPDSTAAQAPDKSIIDSRYTLIFDSLEAKLLLDYFSYRVHVLHESITKMGGGMVSGAFGDVFRAVANKEDCALYFEDGKIRVEQLPARSESYARILSALAEYARGTLSVEMVSGILHHIDDTAGPEMLAAARKFGLTY